MMQDGSDEASILCIDKECNLAATRFALRVDGRLMASPLHVLRIDALARSSFDVWDADYEAVGVVA